MAFNKTSAAHPSAPLPKSGTRTSRATCEPRTISVDDAAAIPEPRVSSPPLLRPGAGTILTLINGVLAGVGEVFVGTHSVLITITAVVMAIILAAMVLILHR
jgi:hypothetical protein